VFGTGVAQLVVSALYILTARSMRPDEYGSVVTAIGLGVAGAGFVDLGANAYWGRELASSRITQQSLNVRVTIRFTIVLVVAAVAVAVSFYAAPVFIATGFVFVTTSIVQTVLVPLRAIQRSESVAWLVLVGRLVAIAIFLGQMAIGVGAGHALWTSLCLGDLVLAVCAFVVTPASDRLRFSVLPLANPWLGTRWYGLTAMSTSAQQLDLPIVAALSGSGAAGIYGGVNRWTQPMLVVIGAFTSAAAPFVAAETRIGALKGQLLRASWILGAAMALSIAVFVEAPWLVTTLLGDDFIDSAPVLRLLAVAMMLNAVTQPLIMALQARQRDHLAAAVVAVAVVAQLVSVIALAPKLGAVGAGIGVLVAQVVALVGTVVCIAVVARRRSTLPD